MLFVEQKKDLQIALEVFFFSDIAAVNRLKSLVSAFWQFIQKHQSQLQVSRLFVVKPIKEYHQNLEVFLRDINVVAHFKYAVVSEVIIRPIIATLSDKE